MKKLILFLLLALPMWAQVPAVPPPQVPFSGTVGPGGKFPFFNGGSITMANVDYTMKFPEFTASVLQVISSVPLTLPRTLYAPSASFGFEFTIQNKTTGNQSIVVKPEGNPAATGVTIPNGETRMVIFDGATYVVAGGGGASSGGGIQSINNSTVAAQSIVQGQGISVSTNTSTGTTTISNTGSGQGPGGNPGEVIFQGVSDAVSDPNCSTDGTTANLTCSDGPFITCPTGKTISVTGAIMAHHGDPANPGTNIEYGLSLIGKVLSCTPPNVAVLDKSSTRAVTNTTARWGTDNGPALFDLTNASTGNQSFVIPPGNYLVRVKGTYQNYSDPNTREHIRVRSNNSYTISAGAHIYFVGPPGCDGYDGSATCYPPGQPGADVDQPFSLFWIPPPLYGGEPGGTHNVHIRIDGIISGDNTFDYGVGHPWLNSSNIVFWLDTSPDSAVWDQITHISIDGTGTLQDIYGFSFHGIGGSFNNVTGITHIHVSKGLNVNSNDSQQSFNSFKNGFGIEAGARRMSFIGNRFDNTESISLGPIEDGTECPGIVVSGNAWVNMTHINLSLGECITGAVVSGNTFSLPYNGLNPALNMGAGGGVGAHNNLITGNTFNVAPGRGCYAAVIQGSSNGGGNIYSQNHMVRPCSIGYLFGGTANPGDKPNVIKGDTILGTADDIQIAPTNTRVSLQGAILGGTGTIQNPGQLTSDSWYLTNAGVKYVGTVNANFVRANNLSGKLSIQDVIAPGVGIPGAVGAAGSVEVGGTTSGPNVTGASPTSLTFVGFTVAAGPDQPQNCSIYVAANPAGDLHCAVYAADGTGSGGSTGAPGTLLCQGTVGAPITSVGWNSTAIVGCPVLTAGMKYFIGIIVNSTTTTLAYSTDLGSVGAGEYISYYSTIANCCTFPSVVTNVGENSNLYSFKAQLGYPAVFSQAFNSSNPVPANYLGTGATGTGANCLKDNQTFGECGTGGPGPGPGPGGGAIKVFNVVKTLTLAQTGTVVPQTEAGCDASNACMMVLPSTDTTYTVRGMIRHTRSAVGAGCTANNGIYMTLSYQDPTPNMTQPAIMNMSFYPANAATLATNMVVPLVVNWQSNSWTIIPKTFRQKGNVAVRFSFSQTAMTGDCPTPQQLELRLALYEEPDL